MFVSDKNWPLSLPALAHLNETMLLLSLKLCLVHRAIRGWKNVLVRMETQHIGRKVLGFGTFSGLLAVSLRDGLKIGGSVIQCYVDW